MGIIQFLKKQYHVLQYDYRMLKQRWYSIKYKKLKVVKNKILFDNFKGKEYGDSLKYIAEEIIRRGLNYDLVWTVRTLSEDIPFPIRKVVVGTDQEAREYSSAKIIISNCKNAKPYIKKANQYYIQTWHGSFALKFIEGEVEEKLSRGYIAESKQDSRNTNVMLSSSSMISSIMRKSFWYDGEIWECGLPREDIYFHTTEKDKQNLKSKYNIDANSNILLYAPTFRDNGDTSSYLMDLEILLSILENETQKKWIGIVRLHPNVPQEKIPYKYSSLLLDGSKFPDSQELFLISNVLITDYSSLMMDFGIMRKPVFLYIPDLEKYKKERGLRDIFNELPFPKASTIQQLQKIIEQFNKNSYEQSLDAFLQTKYVNYSDGHASERVVDRIVNIVEGKFSY